MKILSKERISIGIILLLSLILNLFGIKFGLPHIVSFDEPFIANQAFGILKTGNFEPPFLTYPSFYIYLQTLVFLLVFLYGAGKGWWGAWPKIQEISRVHWPPFYVAGRATTAILGTLTVYITYLIGKRCFSIRTAIIGALSLAVFPIFVSHSHYITPNVPSSFFVVLSCLYAVNIVEEPTYKNAFLAGLFAGLAASVKYNAGTIILSSLVATLLSISKKTLNLFGIIIIGSFLGFLVGTPYAVLNLPKFLNDIVAEIYHYSIAGHFLATGENNYFFYIQYLYNQGMGALPFVFSILGLVLSLVRTNKKKITLAVFPIFYYLFLSSFKVNFERNLIPLIPFLAIYTGHVLEIIIKILNNFMKKYLPWKEAGFESKIITLAAVALLLYQPVKTSYMRDIHMSKEDTRNLAWTWIQKNIPKGSKILLQSKSLKPLEFGGHVDTVPIDPKIYKVKDIYAWKPFPLVDCTGEEYIVTWHYCNLEFLSKIGVVIERCKKNPLPYEFLSKSGIAVVVKEFKTGGTQGPQGPCIEIWRIQKDRLIAIEAESMDFSLQKIKGKRSANFLWNGEGWAFIDLEPGPFTLFVKAKGTLCQDIWPIMVIKVDGKTISQIEVNAKSWKSYKTNFTIKKQGKHKISFGFINDKFIKINNKKEDRNLFIDKFVIVKSSPSL